MPAIDPEVDSMLKNMEYYAKKIGEQASAQVVHDFETLEMTGEHCEEGRERMNAMSMVGKQTWDIILKCKVIRANIEQAQSIKIPARKEIQPTEVSQ